MPADSHDLERFVTAQAPVFATACDELRAGYKQSHWMWFIFPHARMIADDNVTILDSCRTGVGIGLLPEYVARNALIAGELKPLLQDYSVRDNWFKAYIPRRRMEIARVKALLAWLQMYFREGSYSDSFEIATASSTRKVKLNP